MVIRILTGKDVANAVAYNEKKIADKQADRLLVANYPDAELAQRNSRFRLDVLQQYARLNPAIGKPSVHLAVAFHPSETLSPEHLRTIGAEVMEGAGYGQQPYLLYQHHDTAHPHIHVVSVNVDAQGNRIDDSFLKKRLQQLRRKLEIKHGLMPAENQAINRQLGGVGEGVIVNVSLSERISRVLRAYTFGSPDSFSQFLQTQRIQMNRQAGRSRSGITFQAVDEKGTLSRAVKASALPRWPTRANCHQLFTSTVQHQQGCERLNIVVRQQLGKFEYLTEADFKQTMREAGVDVFKQGREYLYVHRRSGTVAQERELAPAFSCRVLHEQFGDQTKRKAVSIPQRETPQSDEHTRQLTGAGAILEARNTTDQPQPLPSAKTPIRRQQPTLSDTLETKLDSQSDRAPKMIIVESEQHAPTVTPGTDRLRKKVRKNTSRRIR